MLPEQSAVEFLTAAKEARELSVEDLRDAFAVSLRDRRPPLHEPGDAAPRASRCTSSRCTRAGAISKAYENDGVAFPTDALGAVEGQFVCRNWSARQVFDVEDRFSPYHQYTDKPAGTSGAPRASRRTPSGVFSVSVGTPFAHAKWFRGRDTTRRIGVDAAPIRPAAGSPRPGSPSAGPTRRGRAPGSSHRCWRRCRPARSPGST